MNFHFVIIMDKEDVNHYGVTITNHMDGNYIVLRIWIGHMEVIINMKYLINFMQELIQDLMHYDK